MNQSNNSKNTKKETLEKLYTSLIGKDVIVIGKAINSNNSIIVKEWIGKFKTQYDWFIKLENVKLRVYENDKLKEEKEYPIVLISKNIIESVLVLS